MKRATVLAVAVLTLLSAFVPPSGAVTPDEVLDDPALEARARDISAGLRCLVCQNQSIDDSDADLAKDLRVLVRQRLVEGDSDQEVVGYIVSRYGEFVLLKPRFSARTLILWATPAIILLGGLAYLMANARRRKTVAEAQPLSNQEQAELQKVLRSRDRDS
ncbi:cytochrome c-type biogenesis protein [Hoeflea poritis]|uniref:Cytochrome c-type biogenesis protein n=1 Tax=Hoeflea poritis TaxID=2993659 RepID=A0ABT4VTT7_9HYPH|nr:cytochrome c-type biogenesis protein [Hoeflea poritis]MDA4848125.1 cytochrome c-type biogenesis protein CcmH [Hoeflea poritis]